MGVGSCLTHKAECAPRVQTIPRCSTEHGALATMHAGSSWPQRHKACLKPDVSRGSSLERASSSL